MARGTGGQGVGFPSEHGLRESPDMALAPNARGARGGRAMANATPAAYPVSDLPRVRKISIADLREALARGIDDFGAFPSHAIFLCIFYPVVGIFLAGVALRYNVLPLVFPLVAGFALIGPFAAVGLYELSRRRELGLDSSWQHAFDVFRSPAKWSVFGLGVLLMLLF